METTSAEWYKSCVVLCASRAAIASNTFPLSRTEWPPAPSGSQ